MEKVKFFKYLYFFLKKILFFIKAKNFIFLFNFLLTEVNRIYSKYIDKDFNENLKSTINQYSEDNFVTHNKNTKKWFSHNIVYINLMIQKFDLNLIKNEILEIGSYEGNSATFFLKNINKSNINCVDIWSDMYTSGNKYRSLRFSDIKKNFDYNLRPFNNRLNVHQTTSDEFFKINKKKFDLIYIDASHTYDDVLSDGHNAIKTLNHNGLIIFDDLLKIDVFKAVEEIYTNNKNLEIEFIYHQAIFRYKERY